MSSDFSHSSVSPGRPFKDEVVPKKPVGRAAIGEVRSRLNFPQLSDVSGTPKRKKRKTCQHISGKRKRRKKQVYISRTLEEKVRIVKGIAKKYDTGAYVPKSVHFNKEGHQYLYKDLADGFGLGRVAFENELV